MNDDRVVSLLTEMRDNQREMRSPISLRHL
jgi:hypothetical protein